MTTNTTENNQSQAPDDKQKKGVSENVIFAYVLGLVLGLMLGVGFTASVIYHGAQVWAESAVANYTDSLSPACRPMDGSTPEYNFDVPLEDMFNPVEAAKKLPGNSSTEASE